MKLIFISLLFICMSAHAQGDFDYSVFSRHYKSTMLMDKDSSMMELTLDRMIVKTANTFKIIPIENTGSAVEYKIVFQGFHWMGKENGYNFLRNDKMELFFEYTSDDYVIEVNPIYPIVIIQNRISKKSVEVFY